MIRTYGIKFAYYIWLHKQLPLSLLLNAKS